MPPLPFMTSSIIMGTGLSFLILLTLELTLFLLIFDFHFDNFHEVVKKVMARSSPKKATGLDGVSVAHFKALTKQAPASIAGLFHDILLTATLPEPWFNIRVSLVPKKGASKTFAPSLLVLLLIEYGPKPFLFFVHTLAVTFTLLCWRGPEEPGSTCLPSSCSYC